MPHLDYSVNLIYLKKPFSLSNLKIKLIPASLYYGCDPGIIMSQNSKVLLCFSASVRRSIVSCHRLSYQFVIFLFKSFFLCWCSPFRVKTLCEEPSLPPPQQLKGIELCFVLFLKQILHLFNPMTVFHCSIQAVCLPFCI